MNSILKINAFSSPIKSFFSSIYIYYLFIFIYVLNDALGNSVIPQYNNSSFHDILLYLSIILAFGCLLQLDFKDKENFKSTIFIVIGFFCYLFGNRTAFLLSIAASVLGNTSNINILLRMIFIEKLAVFLFIVLLSLIGILPGREALYLNVNESVKTVTLGYSHANTFSATVGILMMLYVSIQSKKMTNIQLTSLFIISLLTYFITKCRIGFALMLLLIILFVIPYNKILNFNYRLKKVKKYIIFLFIIFVTLNFSLIILKVFFPDNSILLAIDHYIFHGRIGLAAEYMKIYPVTLFGDVLDLTKISNTLWYTALDNGYIINLLYYGVIGLLVYLYIFQKSFLNILSSQNKTLIIVSICFMIWTIYEGMMITASSNFVLLLYSKNTFQISKSGNDYQSAKNHYSGLK